MKFSAEAGDRIAVAFTFVGIVIGTIIGAGVMTIFPLYPKDAPTLAPAPSSSASMRTLIDSPQPLEGKQETAYDEWWIRRSLEFDKCDALRGTPVLGFRARVVCLDARSVKFVGELAP